MNEQRSYELKAPGAAARWASRAVAVGCFGVVIAVYPMLSGRLAEEGGGRALGFYVGYGLTLIGCICLVFRAPRVLSTAKTVIRRCPLRSAILVVNLGIVAFLIIGILRHWGVILFLIVGAAGMLAYLYLSDQRRLAVTEETVRKSPLSFVFLYLCLGIGEVYLRFHPMQVGGGGGGNPALKKLYADLYTHNSFGLRDSEISPKRPRGVYRILALGDSFTYGQGVPSAETYPEQLEALLNDSAEGTRYEVVNAGKRGVNTKWEVAYLEEHGLQFQPNLVIVQFYRNDLERMFRSARSQRAVGVVNRWVRRSYVLFWLRDRFKRITIAVDRAGSPDNYVESIRRNGPGWKECAEAIDRLGAISREKGIPIMMVLFPHPGKFEERTEFVHEAVAKRSREAGLSVIDLSEAFQAVDPTEQIVSEIDHHPSGRLHGVAAARILEGLRESQLIPRKARSDQSAGGNGD